MSSLGVDGRLGHVIDRRIALPNQKDLERKAGGNIDGLKFGINKKEDSEQKCPSESTSRFSRCDTSLLCSAVGKTKLVFDREVSNQIRACAKTPPKN